MDQLWARMQAIYSGLWRSMNNSSDDMRGIAQREWMDAFRRAKLTWGEITRAIEMCASGDKASPDMPPSLPVFLALARPSQVPYHKPFERPALPRTTEAQRRVTGKAEMAKLKALLD